VFGNRALRIFGPTIDKPKGDWRKLHNEQLHNLYSSPIIIIKSRRMRLAGYVTVMGRKGKHIGYWWESQTERSPGRPRPGWVGNIKINLREIGWDGMD
jgi:hypothetical protein